MRNIFIWKHISYTRHCWVLSLIVLCSVSSGVAPNKDIGRFAYTISNEGLVDQLLSSPRIKRDVSQDVSKTRLGDTTALQDAQDKLKSLKSLREPDFVTWSPNKNISGAISSTITPHLFGANGTGQRKSLINFDTTTTSHALLTLAKNGTQKPDWNNTPSFVDSISQIPNYAEEITNETLTQQHIVKQQNDTHIYYNSSISYDPKIVKQYWVNLSNVHDAIVNDLLSKSHRRAATVILSFDFPFYGHIIRNVTIATGGFLYTGDYVHSWLAATQYIAPLMANFDTSLSPHSVIRYWDNGTALTVEWANVSLHDKPNSGQFSFQTTLYSNGDIAFVYEKIPSVITMIDDTTHPVKVGLSDAYIIDRTIFFVRRKTIYEYHRVNFMRQTIKTWTLVYLTALETCLSRKDCASCTRGDVQGFHCMWCPTAHRCSSGMDREKQNWMMKYCDETHTAMASECDAISHSTQRTDMTSGAIYTHDKNGNGNSRKSGSAQNRDNSAHPNNDGNSISSAVVQHGDFHDHEDAHMNNSSIVAIVFLLTLIAALMGWITYAYRYPHTSSGQILIRYRPTQWRWRRGEARYTAATIHM